MGVQFGSPGALLSTTWTNKPATYPVGLPLYISDVGVKGSHWFYDGTRWKPVNNLALLSSLDAPSATMNNSASIVHQYQMPAALLQTGDRILIRVTMSKSGTTDVGGLRVWVGTAGTTSDTLVVNLSTFLAAAQRAAGALIDLKVISATSLLPLPANAAVTPGFSYGTASNSAFAAATTISNVSNSLYVSLGGVLNGTTDTCTMQDVQVSYLGSAN
jgi:hypothetical protein